MDKKYYVTMTDKFMSGWGMAKNKINKLVIVCNTYEEAKVVAENARNRSEMKYINITDKKPYYSSDRYYVSMHGKGCKDEYESWFVQGYFKKEE